jgi:hypothetical protein
MAVHRAHERGGQGAGNAYDPAGGERGLVPHPFSHGVGTAGQAEIGSGSANKASDRATSSGMVGGIIPEWVALSSELSFA